VQCSAVQCSAVQCSYDTCVCVGLASMSASYFRLSCVLPVECSYVALALATIVVERHFIAKYVSLSPRDSASNVRLHMQHIRYIPHPTRSTARVELNRYDVSRSVHDQKFKRSTPRIELGTSCTRSRNHASRPSGRFISVVVGLAYWNSSLGLFGSSTWEWKREKHALAERM
jgi:hypothetical protein